MKTFKVYNTIFCIILLLSCSVSVNANMRGRAQIINNTVVADNNMPLRGGPMSMNKTHPEQVAWAEDSVNWARAKTDGNLNAMRIVCFDAWNMRKGYDYWTVPELLPHLDNLVDNAEKNGMYAIINFHDVASVRYDIGYDKQFLLDFWTAVAPRYANRTHVIYEMFNEPIQGHDQTTSFITSSGVLADMIQVYNLIRQYAPNTMTLLFSFQSSDATMKSIADLISSSVDWTKTAVSFHCYGTKSDEIINLKNNYPVMCTEWDYPGAYTYIFPIDGEYFNGQTLERLGISWLDWRAGRQESHFVGDFLGKYKPDAVSKGYYWPYDNGVGVSDTISPSSPSNLTELAVSSKSISFSWTGSTDNSAVSGYKIYLDGTYTTTTATTSYTIYELAPETSYSIKVSAYDPSGNESGFSNTISSTTTVFVPDAELPLSSSAPTIDGTKEAIWAGSEYDIENLINGSVSSSNDLSGYWTSLWDSTNLYFFAEITDDAKVNDGTTWYNDDCIEIYIDADNSKSTTYDSNDYQYTFKWNDTTPGEQKHSATTGVSYSMVSISGGYAFEAKIPWSTLGITPVADSLIGLDIHVNDDDDGGDRDGKKSWYALSDNSWSDPSKFATVLLTNTSGGINLSPSSNAGTDQSMTLPTDTLTLHGSGNDSDGTISSYLWEKTSGPSATLSGSTTANLALSNLLEGTYIFRLTVTDDDNATDADEVTVVVHPQTAPTNNPPIANAGGDQVLTLPDNSITLEGAASDGDGTIVSYLWIKISGPQVVMSNATTAYLSLSDMEEGSFAFQLIATDDDGATDIDTVTVTVMAAPSGYLEIPATNLAPGIDGTKDTLYTGTNSSIENCIRDTITSTSDLSGSWTSLWDSNYVYFFVEVIDDSKINDSGTTWYKDDGIEIYIDSDNSKSEIYDGTNDFQYTFKWNDTVVSEQKLDATTGITFVISNTVNGYNLEVKLPWSTLELSPQTDSLIGLDVHINDDDNGGDRDAKLAWKAIEDDSWMNPSTFGTAQLSGVPLSGQSSTSYDSIFEVEDHYTIVNETGSNGTVGISDANYDSNESVRLFDVGDKISVAVNVPNAGNYDIDLRLRSGDAANDTIFMGTYVVTVNSASTTFTSDLSSISQQDASYGTCYWGTIKAENVSLNQGSNTIEIQSGKSWSVADYIRISAKGTTPQNQAPLANAGSDQAITLPTNSITLNGSGTDSDGTISSYSWTKVSGPTATLSNENTANLSLSNLVVGTYLFALTVTDDDNATASDTTVVSVNPAALNFVVEAEDNYTSIADVGTKGTIGEVNGNLDSNESVRIYDPGDKIKISFNIDYEGNYEVKVRLRSGTSTDNDSYFPDGYNFTVNGTAKTFTGDINSISAYESNFGGMYWGTMGISSTPLDSGNNYIEVEASDSWGIVDYVQILSINGEDYKSKEISFNRSEDDKLNVRIYPNPATAFLNIATNLSSGFEFQIFNLQGQRMANQKLNFDNAKLDISAFTKGTYLLKIISGNEIAIHKFIVN